ncbi:MAG: hypothetical protein PHS37_10185, partial [Candidatus Omnitrophica bacterium]|nr:hypothetical protein [Candidatus Omnitrophota bacterium]
ETGAFIGGGEEQYFSGTIKGTDGIFGRKKSPTLPLFIKEGLEFAQRIPRVSSYIEKEYEKI